MPARMPERLVMVVDDDLAFRDALVDALTADRVRVVTAGDGVEALERLRDGFQPAVILLDLRLPRLTGEEFLRAIRADPKLESFPVITMTSGVDSTPDADVIGRLHKPFDLADLRAIILSLFEASAA
jgi:two-component system cell cycle response regulator